MAEAKKREEAQRRLESQAKATAKQVAPSSTASALQMLQSAYDEYEVTKK